MSAKIVWVPKNEGQSPQGKAKNRARPGDGRRN